jgi:hypothetical protein
MASEKQVRKVEILDDTPKKQSGGCTKFFVWGGIALIVLAVLHGILLSAQVWSGTFFVDLTPSLDDLKYILPALLIITVLVLALVFYGRVRPRKPYELKAVDRNASNRSKAWSLFTPDVVMPDEHQDVLTALQEYQKAFVAGDIWGLSDCFLPPLGEQIRAIGRVHFAFQILEDNVTARWGVDASQAIKLDEWAGAPFRGTLSYALDTLKVDTLPRIPRATLTVTYTSSKGRMKRMLLTLLKYENIWFVAHIPFDPRYSDVDTMIGERYVSSVMDEGKTYAAFCQHVRGLAHRITRHHDVIIEFAQHVQANNITQEEFLRQFSEQQESFQADIHRLSHAKHNNEQHA